MKKEQEAEQKAQETGADSENKISLGRVGKKKRGAAAGEGTEKLISNTGEISEK